MTAGAFGLWVNTPKSILTLSVAGEVPPRPTQSVADRFEDLLELHDRAAARGFPRLAEVYADRIIDEMTAGMAR